MTINTVEAEYFQYVGRAFNVTEALQDFEAGKLRPKKSDFSRDVIENLAQNLMGLRIDEPDSTAFSMLTGVSAAKVQDIPDSAYSNPVIMAYAGKNRGMLSVDPTGTNYVIVDGNKRIGKAFFSGRKQVDVIVLSAAQSRKYWS